MCGIVGYTGKRQAQPILLNGLQKLEYRGYDSCGIALNGSGITIYKDAVRVQELARMVPLHESNIGIGHTRWATHGAPNKINAHPHRDCSGRIAVVHNGVITNYLHLKQRLISEGHTFCSETDTEVIAHLVERNVFSGLAPEKAVELAVSEIQGSYAIIVMIDGTGCLIAARKDSPLVIGLGNKENIIASDVTGVLDYTSRVIYLEDGDIAVVTGDRVSVTHEGMTVERKVHHIPWTAEQAQKGGFEHFMLKEIYEQPDVVRDMLAEYLSSAGPDIQLPLSKAKEVLFLACGTSFHAALLGKYLFEQMVGIPSRAELASEFNYFNRYPEVPLVIGISQSGETADTLKALKKLKENGSRVQVITNVVNSSASRLADVTLYTRAGPEISVAATKSFTAQLLALYWMVLSCSGMDIKEKEHIIKGLRVIPARLREVLDLDEVIAEYAGRIAGYDNVFFVGRGINYPVAMEGALKLKEVSYIHSEAYAGGELKHGPFALLCDRTPVVALVVPDISYEAMLTNIKEIKARNSPVLALVPAGDDLVPQMADMVIRVPEIEPIFSPFVNTVILQLLAYYTAKKRGCPIDFPRNLAKSVTVE